MAIFLASFRQGGGYPQVPVGFFEQKDFPLRGYGGGYPLNGKIRWVVFDRFPLCLKIISYPSESWVLPIIVVTCFVLYAGIAAVFFFL